MSDTIDLINRRLANSNLTAEQRARALQAAYVSEGISNAFAALGRAVGSLYRRWREWSETQRSIAYLRGLDERLLADVGLSGVNLEEELHRRAHLLDDSHAVTTVNAVVAGSPSAKPAANQDRPVERTAA